MYNINNPAYRRFFLALLISFFAATAGAQTVTIPDDVSRWFLEQNERVKILEVQIVDLREDINVLQAQVVVMSAKEETLLTAADVYKEQIALKQEQLDLKTKELRNAKREIIKQKILKVLGWAAAAAATAAAIIVYTLFHD